MAAGRRAGRREGRRALDALLASCVAAGGLLASATMSISGSGSISGSTGVAGASEAGRSTVDQGLGPAALAGAQAAGAVPAATPMTVTVVLRARHWADLEAGVEEGWKGPFLSVRQFADRFGQTPAVVSGLTSYLQGLGISTTVSPDRLLVTARGTAAQFQSAFAVPLGRFRVVLPSPGPSAARSRRLTVRAPTAPASLPTPVAGPVLDVLGLDDVPIFVSQSHRALGGRASPQATGAAPLSQSPAAFAQRYGLAPLYGAGADGTGQTVGIVTLASLDPAVPTAFWQGLATPRTGSLTVEQVDGGAGPVSLSAGSDETTLDVEQAGAIAPGASVLVYEAPDSDAGFIDAWSQAALDDQASSISTSWGESVSDLRDLVRQGRTSPDYSRDFDQVLGEAAAQGQSAFAASGDCGAYDAACDLHAKNLSVDLPAGSPLITAAGGTTLAGVQTYTGSGGGRAEVTVSRERAWSWDYLWPLYAVLGPAGRSEASFAKHNAVGTGGGYLRGVTQPAYQRQVTGARHFRAVEHLVPYDPQPFDGRSLPTRWRYRASPPIVAGRGANRAVPDVSADADPQTGYVVYDPQFSSVYGSDRVDYGGTSFVAPQLAAAAAVIDQRVGRRVGFWNPAIYRFAQEPGSPFTPLDTTGAENDNLYYTGRPGTVFNAATGLGVPNLSLLAQRFAAEPATPAS